jgi:glycogen operon protein
MLTTLFASLGTPMLVAGDEFGRSQGGNNNAYCHDDAISWLDWSKMDTDEGKSLFAFTARLTELRRQYPMLRAPSFLYGDDIGTKSDVGVGDIEWWDERGEQLSGDDWNNPEGRALLMRRAITLESGEVEAVSLLLNASDDAISFHMPPPHADRVVLIDSTKPDQGEIAFEDDYELAAHGAALVRWRINGE